MEEFPSGQRGQTVNLLLRLRWFESTLFHQLRPADMQDVIFCLEYFNYYKEHKEGNFYG